MKATIIILLIFIATAHSRSIFAKDYIVYSIAQDIPMGEQNETLKKNFYIDMGKNQGIKKGTSIEVYRVISRLDPYKTNQRHRYKIKIGELEVIHSEDEFSIAFLKNLSGIEGSGTYFEYDNVMIGDKVSVKITQ